MDANKKANWSLYILGAIAICFIGAILISKIRVNPGDTGFGQLGLAIAVFSIFFILSFFMSAVGGLFAILSLSSIKNFVGNRKVVLVKAIIGLVVNSLVFLISMFLSVAFFI